MLKEVSVSARTGVFAGLVGGIGLFPAFLLIDTQLGVPPGTFYKMVGLAAGTDGFAATAFGLISHLLTAALIGTVFCVCSKLHRMLGIDSIPKGIFAGGITGIEVYAVFFLPITMFVMIPAITDYATGIISANVEDITVAGIMMDNINSILWGALAFHVIYGMIMGLFSGLAMYEDYQKTPTPQYKNWLHTQKNKIRKKIFRLDPNKQQMIQTPDGRIIPNEDFYKKGEKS